MATEIKKPTTFTEGALLLWTNEANCYDVQGTGGDETTFGYQTLDTDEAPSIRFHTWQAKVETYSATVLKLKWKTSIQTGDDEFGIEYTKNGGGAWADLVTKGVNRSVAYTTAEIALDANQDLTQVEVRVNSDKVKGADGCDLQISDIWTEGTYTPGNIIVTPTPVSAISTALIGAILLGSTLVSPSPAVVISERVNPVVVLGNTLVAPSPAESIATTINPTVILGNSLVSPNPASAVSAVIDPTVIIGGGGELVTPDPITAVSTTINPTVVLGNSSVVPSPASSVGAVINPVVKLGSTAVAPNPASAIVVTINPNVIKGSTAITPTPVSSIGTTVNPTVIQGSLLLSLTPVSSIGAVVDPVVKLGSILVSPSPASAIGAVVDPTVIITTPVPPKLITGVMSESLHVRGIMSKEFSAIRCLDFNGSTDYVNCGNKPSIDIASPITIETWMSVVEYSDRVVSYFLSKKPSWEFGVLGTYEPICGGVDGRFYFVDSNDTPLCSNTVLNKNQPHHIISTNDGSITNLYLNCNFEGSGSQIVTATGNDLFFGQREFMGFHFYGKIYVVRIYSKTLNATERQNNFNGKITQDGLVAEWLMREQQGNIIHDTSINSNHGEIFGADWYEEKFNTPLKGIMSNSSEITGIMTAEYI